MYPHWNSLSQYQKRLVNNGCGPSWFPSWLKQFLKKWLFSWQFHSSCGHHDHGYIVGGNERRRLYCDWRFACAEYKDVRECWKHGAYLLAVIGFFVGLIFAVMVLLFGWLSFEYGSPKSQIQVLSYIYGDSEKTTLKQRLNNWRW